MTGKHVKGAISKALGKLEEGFGKLTGNKKWQGQAGPGRRPEGPGRHSGRHPGTQGQALTR
jgi:hypothetical protein